MSEELEKLQRQVDELTKRVDDMTGLIAELKGEINSKFMNHIHAFAGPVLLVQPPPPQKESPK